jgi:hypothetical protein
LNKLGSMETPALAGTDLLQQPPSRWRALPGRALVMLAAIILTTLASFTTLPVVGWGGSGTLILLFFPLVLVGWMSIPNERIFLVLATAVYVLFYVLLWSFAGVNWIADVSETRQETSLVAVVAVPAFFLGVFALPLYLIVPLVIGIWTRKLTRIPIDRAPILAILCLAIAGVLYYSWSVDGWRYVCAETGCRWPFVRGDPGNGVSFSDNQYGDALSEAASHSLARGDRERAREILSRFIRFAFQRRYHRGNLQSIAKLLPEAGTYREVDALLATVYPDEKQRGDKSIEICVETGEYSCARFFADGTGALGQPKVQSLSRDRQRERPFLSLSCH